MNKASISQLTIGGFQSLRDRVDIPIAPMTFLFGPNSAGKSTLIDAVRLLHLLTNPSQSSETLGEVITALHRDTHKGATSGGRPQVTLGAEVSELPAEVPECLLGGDEGNLPGRIAADAIWQHMTGSRAQLEIVIHPDNPSLRTVVDGEPLVAREGTEFFILLDKNLRLPGDPAYVPTLSEVDYLFLWGSLRINLCHAAWKGTEIEEQLLGLARYAVDAKSPEVRACLKREGDFLIVGGITTEWISRTPAERWQRPFMLLVDEAEPSLHGWLNDSPQLLQELELGGDYPLLREALSVAATRSDWKQERLEVLDLVSKLCEALQSLMRLLHATIHEALAIPLVPADRGTLKPSDACIEFDPDGGSAGSNLLNDRYSAIQRYAAWHALRAYGASGEGTRRHFFHLSEQLRKQTYPGVARVEPSIAFEARADLVNTVLERDLMLGAGYKVSIEAWHMQPLQPRKSHVVIDDWLLEWPAVNKLTSALYLIDRQGRSLDFKDVGSGVSYVLPVLAALWDAQRSWIEQPELHLHPAAQCGLGDVFIRAFNRGNFSIVETHSEHLLLRVLRRIRESTAGKTADPELRCSPESVSVLYFNPQDDGTTTIHPLRVSRGGDFMDRWPAGFFDERERELFDE